KHDEDGEQAAFRTVGTAAPQSAAGERGVQQMSLTGEAAVGRAVEVGLGPVPCRVAADGPPRRAGEPDADAEDDADERGLKDADRIFAAVAGVNVAEEGGGEP